MGVPLGCSPKGIRPGVSGLVGIGPGRWYILGASTPHRGCDAVPLLDHFHPPLSERRHWRSFIRAWATYLSSRLNALLPAGYFAEPDARSGAEVTVTVFE